MTRPDDPGPPRPYPFVPPGVDPPVTPGPPDRPGTPGPEVPPRVPPGTGLPHDDLRRRVHDQLLERRTVMLEGPLDTQTASLVSAQLMSLDTEPAGTTGPAGTGAEGTDAEGAGAAVTLLVNSSGGPVDAVPAILDTIDIMRCAVATTCIGQAAGTAAVVVASGTGTRRAGPSALLRLRLPELELDGSINRLRDEADRFRRSYEALIDRLAATTGQERRLLARDVERGRLLPADEAVSYGLVDEVISRTR